MDLQVPADISKCDVRLGPGTLALRPGAGTPWHLWILDVGGVRVILQSTHTQDAAQHQAELKATRGSVQTNPKLSLRRYAQCYRAWEPDTGGHTYQLFASETRLRTDLRTLLSTRHINGESLAGAVTLYRV